MLGLCKSSRLVMCARSVRLRRRRPPSASFRRRRLSAFRRDGARAIIATACSQVPEGHEHWTLRLLAGKMVELAVVDAISYETVRRTLKKTK